MLDAVLLVTATVGLLALADDCAGTDEATKYTGMTQHECSIALIEGTGSANVPAADGTEFVPRPPNQRSIELMDDRDPTSFPAIASEPSVGSSAPVVPYHPSSENE